MSSSGLTYRYEYNLSYIKHGAKFKRKEFLTDGTYLIFKYVNYSDKAFQLISVVEDKNEKNKFICKIVDNDNEKNEIITSADNLERKILNKYSNELKFVIDYLKSKGKSLSTKEQPKIKTTTIGKLTKSSKKVKD